MTKTEYLYGKKASELLSVKSIALERITEAQKLIKQLQEVDLSTRDDVRINKSKKAILHWIELMEEELE